MTSVDRKKCFSLLCIQQGTAERKNKRRTYKVLIRFRLRYLACSRFGFMFFLVWNWKWILSQSALDRNTDLQLSSRLQEVPWKDCSVMISGRTPADLSAEKPWLAWSDAPIKYAIKLSSKQVLNKYHPSKVVVDNLLAYYICFAYSYYMITFILCSITSWYCRVYKQRNSTRIIFFNSLTAIGRNIG